jgi:hypothetical protein
MKLKYLVNENYMALSDDCDFYGNIYNVCSFECEEEFDERLKVTMYGAEREIICIIGVDSLEIVKNG